MRSSLRAPRPAEASRQSFSEGVKQMHRWFGRRTILAVSALAFGLVLLAGSPNAAQDPQALPVVSSDVRHDTSPPLSTMRPTRGQLEQAQKAAKTAQLPGKAVPHKTADADTAQGSAAVAKGVVTDAMPSFDQNFEGVGNVNGVLPPDTQGDVGPNHYVTKTNMSFAISN